jgi:pyruvate ferredoxin oxidoreductase beta subunit
MALKDLPKEEYILQGNASCPGCPITVALRTVLKALGKDTIVTVPASCSAVIESLYPKTSFGVPTMNIAFEAAAAGASGVEASMKAQGRDDITVLAWAGDGGSYDIGLQALSGALERGTDFLYVCYNNQMYSNTGIQRSGATPYGAWTTTTWKGKKEQQKNLAEIAMAHEIPYVATASIAYPEDLYRKTLKAKETRGPKYMEILCPCPPGWRFDMSKTVTMARLAVETGMWLLYEYEDGSLSFNPPSKQIVEGERDAKPIEEWLRLQGRFRNLTDSDVDKIKEAMRKRWAFYRKKAELYG